MVEMLVGNWESFSVIVRALLSVSRLEHASMIPKLMFMTHKYSNSSSLLSWPAIARNNIIRNIELKVAFKPSFIESENVNINLFKKERYLHFLISAAANINMSQIE